MSIQDARLSLLSSIVPNPADPAIPSASPTASEAGGALLSVPHEVQVVLNTATRFETPCGTANMVWHAWQPAVVNTDLAPVVLLHGGSGSWTHWLRNILALVASGRRVYVPDLPGFGDSALPLQGNDANALPEPLEQGLQLLLGDEACDLVGFSFGGLTSGLFSVQFPARVARMVLVGAPGFGLSRGVKLQSWRHVSDAVERTAIHRSNLAALMIHNPQAITDLALNIHITNVTRDRMRGRSLARTDALLRALMQVKCPVYAIYGSEDALYPGKMDAVELALRYAPDFKGLTRIPDTGHWVQFERANAFNEALLIALIALKD